MRTLVFSDSHPGPSPDHQQLLAQAMSARGQGFEVLVVAGKHGELPALAQAMGLPVRCLDFDAIHKPWNLVALQGLLRKYKPAMVVSYGSRDGNSIALAARMLSVAGLLSPRPVLTRVRTYMPARVRALGINQLFDQTFTSTQALADRLRSENPQIQPGKVAVLHPVLPSDAALSHPEKTPLSQWPELERLPDGVLRNQNPAHRLLLAGMVITRPDEADFMLTVMQALHPVVPDAQLLLPVDPDARATLESAVQRLGLGACVHLLSVPSQEEHLPRLLEQLAPQLHLVVFAQVYALFEPAVLQAQMQGHPVVVGQLGALPELVKAGQGAWVCPAPHQPGASQQWANTLIQVLADPANMAAQGALAKAHVQKHFSAHRSVSRLLGPLQQQLLGR